MKMCTVVLGRVASDGKTHQQPFIHTSAQTGVAPSLDTYAPQRGSHPAKPSRFASSNLNGADASAKLQFPRTSGECKMTTLAHQHLQGKRILVVEDEALVAREFKDFLIAAGASVVGPVGRVAKGLDLLERECPDAAILDLNLRGERPVALAKALNERQVPFVIVSGYSLACEEPCFRQAPKLKKPAAPREVIHALVDCTRLEHKHGPKRATRQSEGWNFEEFVDYTMEILRLLGLRSNDRGKS
jgi:CheY-like chemotaxis protein